MAMTADTREVAIFERRFARIPGFVVAQGARDMEREMRMAERLAQRHVRKDTQKLMRSIDHDAHAAGSRVIGRFGSELPYARVSERGRRPRKKMPPKGVLLPWMARHNIPEEAEFLLRRAIGRRGIPAQPFASRARDELRPWAPRFRPGIARAVSLALRGRA